MESYWPRSKTFRPTLIVACPERQIKPVSRLPLSNDTMGMLASRMMRPYDKCLFVLLSGVTDTWRPLCWFVFRKTIRSVDKPA
jgi:hypothetical protein